MRRFLLKLFRRRRMEHDIEAELAFHREMSAESGNPIPLGDSSRLLEQARDHWRFNFAENLWRDLVFGARSLRHNPGLVVSALLSLGLGIGANTAIFSLGMEFLFTDPPVRDSGSLVRVRIGGSDRASLEVLEFLRKSNLFSEVTGDSEGNNINWNNGRETRSLWTVVTAENYFDMLGAPLALGRGYSASDPKEVVVLRDAFWRTHYGGDPAVVGRTMRLDGKIYTIMGVLAPSHRAMIGLGLSPDIYIPRYLETTRFSLYGRLKPDMTASQAYAGVITVARRMDREMPMPRGESYVGNSAVYPLVGFARLMGVRDLTALTLFFALLLTVVGLVLLVACVNVTSLLLARASARSREIAIRMALGAGRGRLLQQLLAESLLLSLLGAVSGVFLAHLIGKLVAGIRLPVPFPIRIEAQIDWRVGTYTAILATLCTVACGLMPAWHATRDSITRDFHRDGKMRIRRLLVVFQVAISVVILTTGFVFLRNLYQSAQIDPGFALNNTLRADVNLPPAQYRDAIRKRAFVDAAVRELSMLPGVKSVAATSIVPFMDNASYGTLLNFESPARQVHARFTWNAVAEDYFRTLTIPILSGREFVRLDRDGDRVVVVNRTFVQKYLDGVSPIGARFSWDRGEKKSYRILGVCGDSKSTTIGEDQAPQIYEFLPQLEDSGPKARFVMQSSTPVATQVRPMRATLERIEPAAAVEAATLASSIGIAFLPSQIGATVLGSLGVLGLLLAVIGLYGVMAYTVARRTREIGVRIAIGASRAQVARAVLGDAAKLLVWGASFGLSIAYFATKPLAMFLVSGLKPADPLNYLAVAAVLVVAGLAAALSPARRAAAIDPATCLRTD